MYSEYIEQDFLLQSRGLFGHWSMWLVACWCGPFSYTSLRFWGQSTWSRMGLITMLLRPASRWCRFP